MGIAGAQERPKHGSDASGTRRRPGTEASSSRHARLPLARLAHGVGVHRDRALDAGGELHARHLGQQELRGVTHAVGDFRVQDFVVEVDARRAPHHDLVGLVALEELERAPGHAIARRRVALLVVHDAAAVGRAADGHVIEAEAVEDGGDRADHMRSPQHVAAEIEDDRLARGRRLGRRQPPRSLVGARREVVGEFDLPEVLSVVEAHRASPCRP